jgi:peroxiredoxin
MYNTADMPQPMIGDPAPKFTLVDTAGETFNLEDYRGRFVVIHFGTSW